MMASSGIVLTIVTGFLLVNCISVRFTLLEKVGLSFLCGLALQTFLMLCLDMVSVPLTGFSVIGVQLVSLLSFIAVLYKRKNLKHLFFCKRGTAGRMERDSPALVAADYRDPWCGGN